MERKKKPDSCREGRTVPFHCFAVPVYGDSPYLEACIRSLMAQSVPSKIILCTATPSERISEVAKKYALPLYVREGEPGIKDDWNFAYEKAKGHFVTLAHQDDLYRKEYTACLLKAARAWPDLTVFTTDYAIIRGRNLVTFDRVLLTKRLLRLPLRLRRLCGYSWIKRFPLLFGNAICCPATAYRKETAGTPLIRSDDRFVLDWACLLRLSRLKGRFICEEKPLLLYREHALSATSACIKDRARAKEERAMFSALWPEWAAAILARFYSSASDAYMS